MRQRDKGWPAVRWPAVRWPAARAAQPTRSRRRRRAREGCLRSGRGPGTGSRTRPRRDRGGSAGRPGTRLTAAEGRACHVYGDERRDDAAADHGQHLVPRYPGALLPAAEPRGTARRLTALVQLTGRMPPHNGPPSRRLRSRLNHLSTDH